MCFTINVSLAWVFVIIIPFVILFFGLIIKFAMPIFTKVFPKYDALNESVQENVNGIRVVKNFVREDFEKEKFAKASGELRHDFVKAERIVALNGPVLQLAINIAVFVVAIVGAILITKTNFY